MKKILLDDEQRKRIINKVRPDKKDRFSYDGLDLYTAVYDEETDSVLTPTYYVSEFIKRMGDVFDDEIFILLIGRHEFLVKSKRYFDNKRELKSPCPTVVSDEKIIEMIEYYYESAVRDKTKTTYDPNFTENYLNNNYFNKNDDNKTDETANPKNISKMFFGCVIGLAVWFVYFYLRHFSL